LVSFSARRIGARPTVRNLKKVCFVRVPRQEWRMHLLGLLHIVVLAAGLPTFEDFRQADRERRESGQFQTAKADELTRVSSANIQALAAKRPEDASIQWGAAELLTLWAQRKPLYEAALNASGTNLVIALRYGCAAAVAGDDSAGRWLRYCQQRDASNAVPWVAEAWVMLRDGKPIADIPLPATATQFRDGSAEAVRARIRLLEELEYSAYSARRIGYRVEMPVLGMMRDLAVSRWASSRSLVQAMQHGATFIIAELVGQSVEIRWLKEEEANAASVARMSQLQERREALQRLVSQVADEAVNTARERELVEYFDRMLTEGEEAALYWLKQLGQRDR
jgi:hypothetical protein